MTNPYEKAVARIQEIDAAIAKADALRPERAELATFIETYRRLSGEVVAPTPVRRRIRLVRPIPKKDLVGNAAEGMIRERGKPMSVADLHAKLLVQGIKLDGETPSEQRQKLSILLYRDKRFKNAGRDKGWWLAAPNGAAATKAEEPSDHDSPGSSLVNH